MSERAVKLMTADEFLVWAETQPVRHELVFGQPVAMAGARRQHDRIVANLTGLLFTALREHRCQNFTADFAVRIPSGNIRRPDAGIDCGPFDRDALAATEPVMVAEVLSPSTRAYDVVTKLEEYKTVPSLRHILLVDPDAPQAAHWSRDPAGVWRHEAAEGLAARVILEEPALTLDLATLYEGTTFPPRVAAG
jgi:Uma2 family endonuclease